MATIFETARLRVRHFTASDYDNYFALQGNPVVMQYIRPARTRQESDFFLAESILGASPKDYKGYWAVEDKEENQFLGCFVIIPIPDASKLTAEKGLFWYSTGPENNRGYTFWIDEVRF